ncbi:MAG: hypothetical protein ACXIUB_00595 [Wenzhouxiangella sp.]
MSLEPDTLAEDYRLADYKPLLPLRPETRVLLAPDAELPSLPHLLADLDRVDHGPAAHDDYDLLISDNVDLAGHLGPDGLLCLLGEPLPPPEGFRQLGVWQALPRWPAFRALTPADSPGQAAMNTALGLEPGRAPLSWLRRQREARQGISLFIRAGDNHTADHTLLARADRALGGDRHFQPERWTLVSGRLGPGNPILAFHANEQGQPDRLIKLARERHAKHLALEAQQIQAVQAALGAKLAERIIAPTGSATIDDRHALAYDFVPTHRFAGLGWRLGGRGRLCHALTGWLVEVAKRTRRDAGPAIDHQSHRQPLSELTERAILPDEFQQDACEALDWLTVTNDLPTVLEHGDLGIYNLRLTDPATGEFKVLDWGSSTHHGIAAGDLLYLLSSSRAPRRLAVECLRRYLQALDLPPNAAAPLWWAYLARRWAELDRIRPPQPGQPTSGGGLLLAVHAQLRPVLSQLERA